MSRSPDATGRCKQKRNDYANMQANCEEQHAMFHCNPLLSRVNSVLNVLKFDFAVRIVNENIDLPDFD
jgi:hypothetical protein